VRIRLFEDSHVTAEAAASLVGQRVEVMLDGERDVVEVIEAVAGRERGVEVIAESLLTRVDEANGRALLARGSVRMRT
jgi:hypothetical protein